MAVKFTNNAATTLSSAVAVSATSMSVASSSGFPPLSAGDYFYVSIDDEILKVTAVSGTTWTIDAATAAHDNSSEIELRVSAEVLNDVRDETTYTGTGLVAVSSSNVISTTANNYTHPSVNHIPTGGSADQYLKYSSAGTAAWADLVNSVENSVEYTATASQTTFSATYTAPYLQVFLNGVRLDAADYTATNGTSVVLDTGAALNDVVFILAFGTFTLADHYSKTASDARYTQGNETITLSGDVSGSGTTALTVTVADDSHNHIISNVDGLQTALDAKVDDSQVLTNVPSGAVFTDTVYTHPTTAGNKHIPTGGASGQVLSYASSGTATWSDPAGGGVESGTKMLFWQAAAPTDWTQDITHNNKGLRVVSGTGGGNGGTTDWTSPSHSLSAGSHTLTTSQMPSHSHSIQRSGSGSSTSPWYNSSYGYSASTGSTGGSSSHSHSLSGSISTMKYVDVIICTKD